MAAPAARVPDSREALPLQSLRNTPDICSSCTESVYRRLRESRCDLGLSSGTFASSLRRGLRKHREEEYPTKQKRRCQATSLFTNEICLTAARFLFGRLLLRCFLRSFFLRLLRRLLLGRRFLAC